MYQKMVTQDTTLTLICYIQISLLQNVASFKSKWISKFSVVIAKHILCCIMPVESNKLRTSKGLMVCFLAFVPVLSFTTLRSAHCHLDSSFSSLRLSLLLLLLQNLFFSCSSLWNRTQLLSILVLFEVFF